MDHRAIALCGLLTLPIAGCGGNTAEPRVTDAAPIERALQVPTPAAALGATFLAPGKPGRHPAVVIVHGSGSADRDMTVGPNAPYRDLATGLAARGVASLRYDKRTKVKPFWFANRVFTVQDETIEDALAAVALVRLQPEVDPTRVVVIGHSLGGMLAPRIAAADSVLAGIVIMAGATESSLTDQIVRQFEYIGALPGADTAAIRAQMRIFEPMIERVRNLRPADSASTQLVLGAPAAYWLDLAAYSSAATLRQTRIPALVLQGGRDYQVTTEQLDQWLTVLGPRGNVTVKRYAALDHFFMAGNGPSRPEDYAVERHVDDGVIDDIAAWTRALKPARR